MNFNKNYYGILGIPNNSTPNEIKKAYYKLSFTHHPDKGGNPVLFAEITEAYDVLAEEGRSEYDLRSRFGNSYDEDKELLSNDYQNTKVAFDNDKLEKDWDFNELNIIIRYKGKFSGKVEYERWVLCKECEGNGRDTKSKIEIKDEFGNLLKLFDGSDGCDFCDGTGKDTLNNDCRFCLGKGKVGWSPCSKCKGERRFLGKQKIEGIKIKKGEKSQMIESMGHFDKFNGRVGHLWIVKED